MFEIRYDETGEATRIVRTGMFVVVVLLGGFLLWSSLAPISGAVVADGSIKISSKRKTIQHLEGGIVKEILVKEGQQVEVGQVLLVLQDAEVRSNLTILTDQLNSERAREARLMAEKKLLATLEFPNALQADPHPKIQEMLANERALFQTRKKTLDDEIAVIKAEIQHARQEETSTNAQIAATSETIRFKRERVAAGEVLSAKQYLEKNQLLILKEDLSQTQANLGQYQSQLSALKQRQGELELRIINLRNDFAKTADNELKEAKKTIYEIEEKIQPARLSLDRFQITAPIAGQVIDLKVSTVGGVVRSGDPLMDIVPVQHELIVEVQVKTRDIAKVHMGQRADLQLLAYSTRTVPHIDGSVIYVSEDALEPQPSAKEPYYMAYVRVDDHALDDLPHVHLSPGMPVTAYIQTKPTTFMDMLLKPFQESVGRGMRPQS